MGAFAYREVSSLTLQGMEEALNDVCKEAVKCTKALFNAKISANGVFPHSRLEVDAYFKCSVQ